MRAFLILPIGLLALLTLGGCLIDEETYEEKKAELDTSDTAEEYWEDEG